jgi:hypothetical protein
VLPTFFVIGAAKSGTTSLRRYLGLHPEIYMPPRREPGFFCREEDGPYLFEPVTEREEYEALFESKEVQRGDSTPSYSQYPWRSDVPERIHELVPNARFIYLVRDPVERVVAHVQHSYSLRAETRPAHEALDNPDDPLQNHYLIPSLYATQVERYREVFPHERILVVDSADLKSDRAASMRRIFNFLGVDDTFASTGFSIELNPGQDRRLPSPRYARLRNSRLGAAWRLLPAGLRAPIGRRMVRTFTAAAQRPRLDDDLRLAMENVFRPEVARLRSLTGLSFASWSV